jgi:hypothetical protein
MNRNSFPKLNEVFHVPHRVGLKSDHYESA